MKTTAAMEMTKKKKRRLENNEKHITIALAVYGMKLCYIRGINSFIPHSVRVFLAAYYLLLSSQKNVTERELFLLRDALSSVNRKARKIFILSLSHL